jgi:hypothetical protein
LARHPPYGALNCVALPQRPEARPGIFHERLRLVPRGEVRAFRMAPVVGQLGAAATDGEPPPRAAQDGRLGPGPACGQASLLKLIEPPPQTVTVRVTAGGTTILVDTRAQ